MRYLMVLIATLLAVASCTTTEQANEALSTRYLGTPVDDFFVAHGPPASSYRTQDGRTVYIWAEAEQNVSIPGTTYSSVTTVGNTAYVNTNYSPGMDFEIQCQVRIVADRSGRIAQILAHRDTEGEWEFSRCHELFGS